MLFDAARLVPRAKGASAKLDRTLDIVREGHRQIALLEIAHAGDIVRAEIGVVGDDQRAGAPGSERSLITGKSTIKTVRQCGA